MKLTILRFRNDVRVSTYVTIFSPKRPFERAVPELKSFHPTRVTLTWVNVSVLIVFACVYQYDGCTVENRKFYVDYNRVLVSV